MTLKTRDIQVKFICNVYQHTINSDGDWDGYETQWTIKAETLEEANELLWSKCNMHTEPSDFIKFISPIDLKTYPIEKYDEMSAEIAKYSGEAKEANRKEQELLEIAKKAKEKFLESLKKASMATRMTFLDREMPYLA